ncbi:MAG: ArnT family glycosyltransferase [Myxococcota bacterium]
MTERGQPWLPFLGALLAAAWVCVHFDAPLVEDSLFWWIPKAIKAGEAGFPLSPSGTLPAAMGSDLLHQTTIPQWSDGLPDYGHPPLWYWWIGLWSTVLGPSLSTIRLATLLPAMAAGAGFVALGRRLGNGIAGFAIFAVPPFLAQLLRPELDLGLIAVVPWVLIALLDRAWGRFAILSALAVGIKEPGVLLVVPAILTAHQERRFRVAALTPLIVLGGWAWLHGGLAQPERLPDGIFGWTTDLFTVLFIVFITQARFLLLLGIVRFARERILTSFVVIWILFFATVGFFANRGTSDMFTHVRYLLPGLLVATVILAQKRPWLASFGLLFLHSSSAFGPEASMFGIDQARAEKQAAPWIKSQIDAGETIWVGTHQAAALSQSWAGVVTKPIKDLEVYGMSTHSNDINAGDIVLETAYGEPSGAILTGREKTKIMDWNTHDGRVVAWRINDEAG